MNIELKDQKAKKVESKDITIDGVVVGWVDIKNSKDSLRFHVGLFVGNSGILSHGELIQGFGDTLEDAIKDAFERGLAKAENLVSGINALRDRLSAAH